MADSRFFNIPFGTSGDRAVIPETADPSGAVSYAQGFGPDYERDPVSDPLAKRVPRDETNEYLYQITNALKYLQLYGLPEWFAEDGRGNPVSYPQGAQVRHDAGGGVTAWLSIAAANTAEPGTDATKWVRGVTYDQSLTECGWVTLPGGLIVQWGLIYTPDNPTLVNLPRAFPNAQLHIFATESGGGLVRFGASPINPSQARIWTSVVTSGRARYLSIGY